MIPPVIRQEVAAQLNQLLPLKQLIFVCEITAETKPQYFHQTGFPAYLYTLLDNLAPEQAKTAFRIILPETGGTYYQVGDEYRFAIVTFNRSEDYLTQIIAGLAHGIAATDRRIWHQNLRLKMLIDGFTGAIIHEVSELSEYTYADIQRDSACLQTESAELLIESGILFNTKKITAADLSDSQLILQLVVAVIYATPGMQDEQTRAVQQLQNGLEQNCLPRLIHRHHLFFINKTYSSAERKYKYLSGYHGQIILNPTGSYTDDPDTSLLSMLLVLGQYLGIGKRSNYGIGQYRLICNGRNLKYGPNRSCSLLRNILSLEHITRHEAYAAAEEADKRQVLKIADDILSGHYCPQPLSPATETYTTLSGVRKPRCIRIASLPETIVQQIIAQALSRLLDPLHYHTDYSCRPGYKRKQAVQVLKKHIDSGCVWLLETDIADCLNSLAHSVPACRLQSLLPDTALCRLILQMIAAPDSGEENPRSVGIAQGSPLQSLLTNLVLSDFDYDFSLQGYQYLRYAGEFVVCCRSEEEAKAARRLCAVLLARCGLKLNPENIRIRQISESIIFLEQQPDSPAPENPPYEENVAEIQHSEPTDINPVKDYGQTLLICRGHYSLSLNANQLILKNDTGEERTPLALIGQIILIGSHHLSTPLVQYCLRQGIHVHYLSATGKHLGTLDAANRSTHEYKVQLWLTQERQLSDDNHTLQLSREIISARIHNMRKTLLRYQRQETLSLLEYKMHKVARTVSIDVLRGHEGMATRYYYLQLNQLLQDTPFRFPERNRRPPKDPVNVLLSYGYSLLYQYLHSFILSLELNPDRGFMHRSQSRSIALCSDLIEPFRHHIERAMLTVIRRKQIRPEHFYYRDGQCLITNEGRMIYTRYITKMLETNAEHADIVKPRYIEYIYRQAMCFKKHIQHPDIITFIAYRE